MQKASAEYKASMKRVVRNRGYIKVTIGVINSEAQNNVEATESDNDFTFFADNLKPFTGFEVKQPYATMEENFSLVDGSMYFLPPSNQGFSYYNNGIVTDDLNGSVKITFHGVTGLDIKGLTINFGHSYPTKLLVATNAISKTYDNDSSTFITEDSFDDVSEITITAIEMVGGQDRLRIYGFTCGIANIFSNDQVMSFSSKEYISSISDSVPSTDMSLKVDNQNLYYSPDNPESTLAYFEEGQQMHVSFGYDVEGDGVIEWIPETIGFLKSWKATDKDATFTATDRFDYLDDTYYKGKVNNNGISLYDLAIDVLNDAGITDEREYWIDPYLKGISVVNPLPPVKHAEALQIIANAGRCALFEDRSKKIHIQSSFIPDMEASSEDEHEYSNVADVLNRENKDAVALTSEGFSLMSDSSMYFVGDTEHINCAYISESISDDEGNFTSNPTITVDLESGYVAYGFGINFRNIAPTSFKVLSYFDNELVEIHEYTPEVVNFRVSDIYDKFDKMVIEFEKATPNSRVFVDEILIGDVTEYYITELDQTQSATATRQNKIKEINVTQTKYSDSQEEIKDLQTGEIIISEDGYYTVYFGEASYGFTVDKNLEEGETASYSLSIVDSSAYFVKLHITGISAETTVKYVVRGYVYLKSEQKLSKFHNENGDVITWTNPLISTPSHAKDIEEWLASYYLGDVEYDIKWRGDPRTDANDLFFLVLKDRESTMIRTYQNEIKFSGAWSGTMKARKAVL